MVYKALVQALVESLLLYDIIAWVRANKSYLRQIQTTQNIILRIILNKNHDYRVENLYKEFNVLLRKNSLE